MTVKEIDGVIDALSRTITELRQTKEKLAEAERTNASNLEIKRNLALRINELQKELADAQAELTKANARHQRDRDYFERYVGQSLMFHTPVPYACEPNSTITFAPSERMVVNTKHATLTGHDTYVLLIPPMVLEFAVDRLAMRQWKSYVPFLAESMAEKIGHDTGAYVRKEVLKRMENVK